MKKVILLIVVLFFDNSLQAMSFENEVRLKLIIEILPILLIFFICLYFVLKFTLEINQFKRKLDYNNKLLELLVLKKDVTKEEIISIRTEFLNTYDKRLIDKELNQPKETTYKYFE